MNIDPGKNKIQKHPPSPKKPTLRVRPSHDPRAQILLKEILRLLEAVTTAQPDVGLKTVSTATRFPVVSSCFCALGKLEFSCAATRGWKLEKPTRKMEQAL